VNATNIPPGLHHVKPHNRRAEKKKMPKKNQSRTIAHLNATRMYERRSRSFMASGGPGFADRWRAFTPHAFQYILQDAEAAKLGRSGRPRLGKQKKLGQHCRTPQATWQATKQVKRLASLTLMFDREGKHRASTCFTQANRQHALRRVGARQGGLIIFPQAHQFPRSSRSEPTNFRRNRARFGFDKITSNQKQGGPAVTLSGVGDDGPVRKAAASIRHFKRPIPAGGHFVLILRSGSSP